MLPTLKNELDSPGSVDPSLRKPYLASYSPSHSIILHKLSMQRQILSL